jgi:hypothetical protein
MEAQAKKTNVEADKLAGADTQNTQANTALTNMKLANEKVQNDIANKTLDEVIAGIKANADKAQSEAAIELVNKQVYQATEEDQKKQIRENAILTAIKVGAEKQGIILSKAQIQNMEEQIKIGKFNAEKITTDQVAGKQLNTLIETIYNKFGIDNRTIK